MLTLRCETSSITKVEFEMSGKHYYSGEKNAQIVIALLKAHGIRRVIANLGTTNIVVS